MANGTSRIPSWLSAVARGVITVVTLPIQLVVRLVERVVSGKEGVKKMDEEVQKQEEKEIASRFKEKQMKIAEKNIKEAVKSIDFSEYGDLAVKKVEISVSEKLQGTKIAYNITCENGKEYTIYGTNNGLARSGFCPPEVEEQLVEILAVAEVKTRGTEPETPEPETAEPEPEASEPEPETPEPEPETTEPYTTVVDFSDSSNKDTAKLGEVRIDIERGGENAGKARCTSSDGCVVKVEKNESGMLVITNGGENPISPKRAAVMSRVIMKAYSEAFPEDNGKLKQDFIDKTYDLLNKAIRGDNSQKLLGVACGNTLFTPDTTKTCAIASTNRKVERYNNPVIDFRTSQNSSDNKAENKIHIKGEIAKAHSSIQCKVAGDPELPISHYTTDDALYIVTQHNNNPEISTFTIAGDCGIIESDRKIPIGEVQAICRYLAESNLVDSELNKDDAMAQFDDDLCQEGDSTFVLCAGGYYAYVEQTGGDYPKLHVGAVDISTDGRVVDVTGEQSINSLAGAAIDAIEESIKINDRDERDDDEISDTSGGETIGDYLEEDL